MLKTRRLKKKKQIEGKKNHPKTPKTLGGLQTKILLSNDSQVPGQICLGAEWIWLSCSSFLLPEDKLLDLSPGLLQYCNILTNLLYSAVQQ